MKRTNISETAAKPQISAFSEALDIQMRKRGDNAVKLLGNIIKLGERYTPSTITAWRRGAKSPTTVQSLELLERIEKYYSLPPNYFKEKLPYAARAGRGYKIQNLSPSMQRRIAWHLPDDFDRRSVQEKAEILEWVQTVIISGSTEYRTYQANALKRPYSVRFPETITAVKTASNKRPLKTSHRKAGVIYASESLSNEMFRLVSFKTSVLTPLGYQRIGVWAEPTALLHVEHLGLFFGALAGARDGPISGLGIPPANLTFALLVFPAIWDWYLQWRKDRRGFYTIWEINMLSFGLALTRSETGWIRQTQGLSKKLVPMRGILSAEEIEEAQTDWDSVCDKAHKYFTTRVREINKITRIHRDPFEAILPVLTAESPLIEYLKIADEILKFLPNERLYPKAAAESVRSFLMLRIALHSGLRQKNLRELLLCMPGDKPATEQYLSNRKCGEIRWIEKSRTWEIFIPAIAFKNSDSSFFSDRPFCLTLPDVGQLYHFMDLYISGMRQKLLSNARDPGTLFIKTVKATSANAVYSQNSFYEVWRATIQKYGIYNPYTRRGAIEGLLPHGPHNIRDVLATHVLKVTGSFEQASYAIQDTPEMVAKHYGRFLPKDKSALAAKILNQVWDE